jgi:16S rRNA (guanine527-N7)-methyltransferase
MPAPDNLAGELADGLRALRLPESLAPPLLAYLDLLERWNRTYNLTSVRERGEMLRRHLLDSLAMHETSTPARSPTWAPAPACPHPAGDRQACVAGHARGQQRQDVALPARGGARLGLANVRVLQSRAENVAEPGAYRLLTARALDRLAGIIEVGGHLLAPGRRLLALKGQRPDAEIAELPPGWTGDRRARCSRSRAWMRKGTSSRSPGPGRTGIIASPDACVACAAETPENMHGPHHRSSQSERWRGQDHDGGEPRRPHCRRCRGACCSVDIDPQGHATMGAGVDKRGLAHSITEVLLGECGATDAIVKTGEGFDLLPATSTSPRPNCS